MKKQLLLLVMMLLPMMANAYDTYIDGIYYNLNQENKSAEVTYNEDYNSYSGDVVIPSEVTCNDITYFVTSIGTNAFYDCTSLTSVVLPNGLTSIGVNAFSDCI